MTAIGTGNVHEWETGILQSISQGSWLAHYSNCGELHYRLNTEDGLVKDAEAADRLFFREGHSFNATASPNVYDCSFWDRDAPAVTFVTEFSGDPFHAHEPLGDGLGQLTRTEGKVNFHSFLAVVNKTTGAILTLGESHWTLTWDGTYDYSKKSGRQTTRTASLPTPNRTLPKYMKTQEIPMFVCHSSWTGK